MIARRLFAIVIIVSMLLVAFNLGYSPNVKAVFIENVSSNGLSLDFYPQDVKWDHTGTMAVVVGYDIMNGPNAYAYFANNDTWMPLDGYYPGQELYSVDYWYDAGNETGNGTTTTVPDVLIVDADAYNTTWQYYWWSLFNCSVNVYLWDVYDAAGFDNLGKPTSGDMGEYDAVFWICSFDMWSQNGYGDPFDNVAEQEVGDYLDAGGNFFMASSTVLTYGPATPYSGGQFQYDYLALSSYMDGQYYDDEVSGTSGDSVYDGYASGSLNWNRGSWAGEPAMVPNYCDRLSEAHVGAGCMDIWYLPGADLGGVKEDGGTWKTMFMGFPFETLAPADADEFMSRAMNWFCPPASGGSITSVLVVDADAYGEGTSECYGLSLLNNSVPTVDLWDVYGNYGAPQGKPTAAQLAPYDAVFWVPDREMDTMMIQGSAGGPFDATDESTVATYLDGGGNFMLANTYYSQYTTYSAGAYNAMPGDFIYDYLGVEFVYDISSNYDYSVNETAGDAVYGGIGTCTLNWNGGGWNHAPPPVGVSDQLGPGPGTICFYGNDGGASWEPLGVRYDEGTYKTVYLGFPFETLSSSYKDDVMAATLTWFATTGTGATGGHTAFSTGGNSVKASTKTVLDQTSEWMGNLGYSDVGASPPWEPFAQSFVPINENIAKAEFYMYSEMEPPDTFRVEICPDWGGQPSAQNITFGWIDQGTIPINPARGWAECWFKYGGGTLIPGQTYWIVVDRLVYNSGQWWAQDNDQMYGDGEVWEYDTGIWTGPQSYDWLFRTYANETTGVPCAVIGPDRDNGIFSESWDESNGAGQVLRAGQSMVGDIRRSFIHFDIAGSIPAGSTIDHVELKMYCNRSSGGAQDVSLRRVQVNWGEGTSDDGGTQAGDPATPNDTTWHYCFYPTTTWFADGGSYAGISASRPVSMEYNYYTWASTSWLVTNVQDWLDNPGSNYGWAIIADESVMGWVKQFASRENSNLTRRPQLKIFYTLPATGPYTVSIQSEKDNTIYDNIPPPEWSNGWGDNLFAGMDATNNIKRSLIKFDIENSIPDGATITRANLTMYCDLVDSINAETVRINSLTRDWGEASSHASGNEYNPAGAQTDDATWNYPFYGGGVNWVSPGGDFIAAPSATATIRFASMYYTWLGPTMVSDVQGWLDNPGTNNGWIIIGNEGSMSSIKRFSSRSNRTYPQRPVLEITYTLGGTNGTTNGTMPASIGTFWMCGDNPGMPATGSTVYKLEPKYNFTMQKVSTYPQYGTHIEFNAIALDDVGNPLCVGSWFTEMYFYNGTAWNTVTEGTLSSYALMAIDYNPNDQRFYAVGYDGGFNGVLYYTDAGLTGSGNCYRDQSTFAPARDQMRSIAWNHLRNYGMVVGDGGVYIVDPYGGSSSLNWTAKEDFTINTYYDCDWDTDGWNEAGIVGTNNTGDAMYWRYYHTNPQVMYGGDRSPPNEFLCCAFKPPSSPKWLFIPFNGGGWQINVQENDQSTEITLNAGFPHIFNVGLWKQNDIFETPLMNTQVDADSTYTFFIQGNYTQNSVDHWSDLVIDLTAWYDNGNTGGLSAPGDPTWSLENFRTQQFNATHLASTGVTSMTYPAGFPQEFLIHSSYADPGAYGPDGSWHRLYVNVTFGPQTRMANSAFFNGGPGSGQTWDPNFALNDALSWDLRVSAYDMLSTGARNESFDEFGIKESITVSVTGSPNGAAPPGTANYQLNNPSNITYSSNINYWVNVSIPELYLNGDILSPNWIPATNVEIQNAHPSANGVNSDASMPIAFAGPGNPRCVWGVAGMSHPPVYNGTQAAGPSSNFIEFWYGVPDYTVVEWWVTIPGGTVEGLYRGTITITIEG